MRTRGSIEWRASTPGGNYRCCGGGWVRGRYRPASGQSGRRRESPVRPPSREAHKGLRRQSTRWHKGFSHGRFRCCPQPDPGRGDYKGERRVGKWWTRARTAAVTHGQFRLEATEKTPTLSIEAGDGTWRRKAEDRRAADLPSKPPAGQIAGPTGLHGPLASFVDHVETLLSAGFNVKQA